MTASNPPEHQRLFNVPASIGWLIAALAAIHILLGYLRNADGIVIHYAFVPERYVSDFSLSLWDRLVPFVSYMGLHSDFTHLGINLLWLLAFGPIVARRFGPFRFYVFFLVCGVAGAVTHLAMNWGSPMPVIGASAAISGLMAAGVRMMPARGPFGQVPANDQALASLWTLRLLGFSAVWLVINAVVGVIGLGGGGEVRVIAWEAHMGGYVAGYLLTGPFNRWSFTYGR
jgi:membrane associated rhomboid family serine protease